ncbi:MAG: serine--tRNA ligase [Candidatus Eisenbacteria bacterium]|nr:serine--tRNA ligase [Candidatus Eisenbacteria bacterium]
MLDPAYIRQHADEVRRAIRLKNEKADVDEWLRLDERWRALTKETEDLRALRNRVSEEIAERKRRGEDASGEIARMRTTADAIKAREEDLRLVEEKLRDLAVWMPNVPHASVPEGDESANRIVATWGEPKVFPFPAKTHWEIGERLGILDLARASKTSGSGFAVFWGAGALLQRALIRFMIDLHVKEHGYREVYAPYLVNRASMFGTGQLPKLEEDMYVSPREDLFLIPTAEVPITNLHRDEILGEDDLPRKYVGYTACFRREAGSAGKETRGLNRLHQFDKVELVRFERAEESYRALEALRADAEDVLRRLGLAYRVVVLAAGDLSFASALTYDLEVWAPGQGRWLEVSSCSNFEDFQARRMRIRYRSEGSGGNRFAHTLNGSGVALPRTTIALLENGQREDGTVEVPEILRPYMDGMERIA